jgi:hypothetical protein
MSQPFELRYRPRLGDANSSKCIHCCCSGFGISGDQAENGGHVRLRPQDRLGYGAGASRYPGDVPGHRSETFFWTDRVARTCE